MILSRLLLFLILVPVSVAIESAPRIALYPQERPSGTMPAGQLSPPENLPAAEFAKMIREFSEEGGSFFSDNLLSNESSYLHIIDKLKKLGTSGGAYLGVGPEQNFTYIAKVRPRIAFIVDIRHLAVIQHLMYKAIFHLAPDRAEFLSLLLSRPLIKEKAPAPGAPFGDVLDYFGQLPADEKFFSANLAKFRQIIQDEFQYRLSESELKEIEYVLKSFKHDGLGMTYQWNGNYLTDFPTFGEVLAATDLNGKQGNFLASREDYDFVRNLQRKNLIIPITGNFGGSKALGAIGDYLGKKGLTVTTFYVSNVEQYLFDGDLFGNFIGNVKKLPINERSFIIRSVHSRFGHPAMLPRHQFTTLLQRMTVFLKDFDEGRYKHYSAMINTNYISGGQP